MLALRLVAAAPLRRTGLLVGSVGLAPARWLPRLLLVPPGVGAAPEPALPAPSVTNRTSSTRPNRSNQLVHWAAGQEMECVQMTAVEGCFAQCWWTLAASIKLCDTTQCLHLHTLHA
jgi:hypothetical protein